MDGHSWAEQWLELRTEGKRDGGHVNAHSNKHWELTEKAQSGTLTGSYS